MHQQITKIIICGTALVVSTGIFALTDMGSCVTAMMFVISAISLTAFLYVMYESVTMYDCNGKPRLDGIRIVSDANARHALRCEPPDDDGDTCCCGSKCHRIRIL